MSQQRKWSTGVSRSVSAIGLAVVNFSATGIAHGQPSCQAFDDGTEARFGTWSNAGARTSADDFRPLFNTLTSVTVWGGYEITDGSGEFTDCAGLADDDFEVAVWSAEPNGLPDVVIAWSGVASSGVTKAFIPGSAFEATNGVALYEYTLTLDTPIMGLDASGATTYWLEVVNVTWTPGGNDCSWVWVLRSVPTNDYSAAGTFGYGTTSVRLDDHAFCVNGDLAATSPVIRACCDCGGACTPLTKRACDDLGARWYVDAPTCQEATCTAGPPTNDSCDSVRDTGVPFPFNAALLFDTRCATTDGPNSLPTETGSMTVTNDLWFKYISPADRSIVSFSICATLDNFDSVIAVYRDPNNPTTCVCPTQENQDELLVDGIAANENCDGFGPGSGGWVEITACEPGECFMIRVAGNAGSEFSNGLGVISVSYVQPDCDYGSATPADVCAGGPAPESPCDPANADLDCSGGWCLSFPDSRYLTVDLHWCLEECGPQERPGAVRVKLIDVPGRPELNGQYRWAGAPATHQVGTQPPFVTAPVGCRAIAAEADWTALVPFHLHGDSILPGATYEVNVTEGSCLEFCTDEACNECFPFSDTGIILTTGQWGDIIAPFGGSLQPNFADISALVAAFQVSASAPIVPRADILGPGGLSTPNVPDQLISFLDINAGIRAFQGQVYPYPVAACP